MASVEAKCMSCDGTGLYHGFAEPKDTAVVCLTCGGTGCHQISYMPFTKRTRRKGIKYVANSRGSFIVTGVGPAGSRITVQEFYSGKMPK